MEAALAISGEEGPKLDAGIADKLNGAVTSIGTHLIPSTRTAVAGAQFRLLADKASLSESEMEALCLWLEISYGESAAERFTRGTRTVTHAMRPAAPAPEGATPERPPPLEAAHGGPSPAYRDFVPPPASEDGLSELFGEAKGPSIKPLAPTAPDSTKASDIIANGAKNEGEVIILTFALFYACLPPSSHEELQYGTAPNRMVKLAKAYKDAGSTLPSLVLKSSTTWDEFHQHFSKVAKALDGYPNLAHRVLSWWTAIQRYSSSAPILREYIKSYLEVYPGRGLPVMMDKDILMLTFGKQISKGSDVSELTTKVNDCLDQIKKIREKVERNEEKISKINNTVEVLKKEHDSRPKCTYRGQLGHTAAHCRKKAADEASAP